MRPVDRFDFLPTPLAGLLTVQRSRIEDQRGFLSRMYSANAFAAAGVQKPIAQMNQTLTRRQGAVRGMHFQWPPHAETKLVTCLHGEIFDVAVDLRTNSPTFLQWHGEVLSAKNQRSLLIPEGFAHGFQTLTEDCELVYLHTAAYEPAAEGAVSATDPRLAIRWPFAITDMSDRDRGHPLLTSDFEGMDL
jgi:dTDP-4-dehydrorhamnose 3,5-epimerase